MIGKKILHYKILENIGQGGMGIVYKAEDTKLGRMVAVKFLQETILNQKEDKARFIREAKSAARLDHPNICAVHETNDHKGKTFIVMPYLEGETLQRMIRRSPLDEQKALDIAIQIAEGLNAAHKKKIIHRDIKSSNIMVSDDGLVRIMDFGLAKSSEMTRITTSGSSMGTVSYMSPEQARGEEVDLRSDIWSFGIVMFEMLTSSLPFEGNNMQAILYKILNDEPADINSLRPGLSGEYSHLFKKLLAKKIENRFRNFKEIIDLLQAMKEGSGSGITKTLPQFLIYSMLKSASKKQKIIYTVATIAAVIAAGVLLKFVLFTDSKVQEKQVLNPKRVMVAVFENLTGDESLNPVGLMASDLLSQSISVSGVVETVSNLTVVDTLRRYTSTEKPLQGMELYKAQAFETKAGVAVVGKYYKTGDKINLTVQILNMETSKTIASLEPISNTIDKLGDTIKELHSKTMVVLSEKCSQYGGASIVFSLGAPPKYEAYKEYLLGADSFGANYDKAIGHFKKALEIDKTMYMVKEPIATSFINTGRYEEAEITLIELEKETYRMTPRQKAIFNWAVARLNGKTEIVHRITTQLNKEYPTSEMVNLICGMGAMNVNKPRLALEVLNSFNTEYLNYDLFSTTWRFYFTADCHYMLSEYEKMNRTGLELEKHFLLHGKQIQVRALSALGKFDEIDKIINDVSYLQADRLSPGYIILTASRYLRAQNHKEASMKYADKALKWWTDKDEDYPGRTKGIFNSLYDKEEWIKAAEIANRVLRKNPNNIDYIGYSGTILAHQGKRDEAENISIKLKNISNKYEQDYVLYYQACITAVLGEKERAVELLKEAFAKGLTYGPYILTDMDLENLRDYEPFKELMRPKG